MRLEREELDRRFMFCFRLVELAAIAGGWRVRRVQHCQTESHYVKLCHAVRPTVGIRFSDHPAHGKAHRKDGPRLLSVRLSSPLLRGLSHVLRYLTGWSYWPCRVEQLHEA